MDYANIDPLYKILCLALIFLVPLAPAWGLYKIAPEDKFLANGTFSGFKVNATGSAAIYIVLFSAVYIQTTPILKQIDRTRKLRDSIVLLIKNQPWKIRYNLKLMDSDRLHEIAPIAYSNYVNTNSIVCLPAALHVDNTDNKSFYFYMDVNDLTQLGDPIRTEVILNGYGTAQLTIPKNSNCIDPNQHVITMRDTFFKVTSRTSQLTELNANRIPVLTKGGAAPPGP